MKIQLQDLMSRLGIGLLILGLSVTKLYAQTTLIDPTGDGGFENGTTFASNGWSVVNGTVTNKWNIVAASTPTAGTKAAYISNDNGVTNTYDNGSACRVHFYRDITFPAGETVIKLTFKWKATGEGLYDYLTVATMPTSVTPVVNSPIATGASNWTAIPTTYSGAAIVSTLPNLNLQSSTQTQTIYLPASFAGTTQRLVFMWNNDGSGGTTPPASVDEISLISRTPLTFTSVTTGGWKTPATWGTISEIPSSGDNVLISSGTVITIDTAAPGLNALSIDGTLGFGSTVTSITAINLLVNGGGLFNVFSGTTGKTLNVSGNITNNGSMDLSVTGAVLLLNGTSTQTVDGFGTLVSNDIKNLTFNNTATLPTINWQWSNNIISGTLTFTKGYVGLGTGNSMVLGTSGTVLGTLTWTSGGFTSGKFARWFGTTGTGTTIAASTIPTFGVGSFPFIGGSAALGFSNCHFHRATAAITSAGTFEVAYNGTVGTNTLGAPLSENGLTFDKQTNASWTVSLGNGYATAVNHTFAIQAQSLYSAVSANARLLIGGALTGTHQAGSILPLAERTAVVPASIAGVYTIGIVTGEVATTTIASGAWDNPAIWSNGVPTCSQSAVVNTNDSVWIDGTTATANATALLVSGKLSISGSSLSVGCANNYNLAQINGKLYVSGGTLTITGALNLPSGSLFSQTGGNINIDGNAAGVVANSVATGTPLVNIATGSVKLSGGIFTIVDPHAGTIGINNNRAFYYTGGTAIDTTFGWALKFGDGVSADAGGAGTANCGYVLEMGTNKIVIDSLVIDAGVSGTNRFVTLNNSTSFGCNNMYITANGEGRISSTTYIAGNLTNNGILTNSAGTVFFGTFIGSSSGATSRAQTISGSGVFRNATTSATANFTNLTVNNTNTTGVTFASANTLLSGSNTGTVSGTLTITKGIINTGSNAFVLGTSAASTGTLTYTNGNGGFGAGSTFSRWWGTAVLGQTITAASIPTAGVGTYPFATIAPVTPLAYNSRTAYIRQATVATAGGTIAIKYNDVNGFSAPSITDGSYTVNSTTNANWQVSSTGITGTPTYTLGLSGEGLYITAKDSSRITLAATAIGGTQQRGTNLPHAQRAAVPLTNLTNTWYLGMNANDIAFTSIASGNWEDPAIWNKNAVPTYSDSVVIAASHTVTINATPAVSRCVSTNYGGTLLITGSSLNVASSMNNAAIRNNGKFVLSAGDVNIRGSLLNLNTGIMRQLGGTITVDANDNGNVATSATTNSVDLAAATDSSLVFTGGTLTIVDPSLSTYALRVSTSFAINFATTHKVIFGNGISTAPGLTNGFYVYLFAGSSYGILGNVDVNTNSSLSVNRFVSTNSTIGILGNLNIISGSYRMASTHYIKGNIVNNDSLINTSTLNMADFTNGVVKANTNTQGITGTGKFLNLTTAPTAGMTSLTINNSSAGGVTLGVKISMSGTLTLTRGIVNTNATDSFRLGTNTAAGTLSGAHDSAYINGPFYRTFAASRTASGTYTAATLYPTGKGGRYLPFWADPTTTAGGPIFMSGESFNTNTGSLGAGATFLSGNRWETKITGIANFTSANIQLTDTAAAFTTTTKIVTSATAVGAYAGIVPPVVYAAGPPKTVRTSAQIAAVDFSGYFAYGELTPCTTPFDQPNSLTTINKGSTFFDASFVAASSAPSHYLVVRYASGGTETPPVNNTGYAVAATLGAGTVVANTTGLIFSQTGLTANTTYDYYVYAYNNSACFGPVYNTVSPLMQGVATCATAVTTPTTAAAVAITNAGFTARWSKNASVTATYLVDISANSGFTSFIPGYQTLSTNADTFVTISGLTSNTSYYYRVRTVDGLCSSTLSSNGTAITACDPVTSFPYLEPFTATLTNCAKVTVNPNDAADFWQPTTADGTNGANAPFAGTHFLKLNVFNSETVGNPYEYLMPAFDLGATPKYMSYKYYLGATGYTTSPIPLTVFISNNGGATWDTLYKHTTVNSVFATTNNISNWTNNTISLAAYSGNVIIKFSARSNYGSGFCNQGLDEIGIQNIVVPTLTTATKSSITQGSAVVGGTLVANGGDAIIRVGIVVGTAANPSVGAPGVTDSTLSPVIQSGGYSKTVAGLTGNTLYHYRAYATNTIGTSYGPDSNFTTLAAPVAPTVNNSVAINIGAFAATVGGNVVSDGGSSIIASGVVYSTSSSNLILGAPDVIDSTTNPLVSSGAYSFIVKGLIMSTKYYYKAYAIASIGGTAYSTLDSFTTTFGVNNYPYAQDFEGGAAGWTSTQIATANDWVLGTPAKTFLNGAHSGTKAWATKLTGDYTASGNAAVVSPVLDLSSFTTDPVLKFYHKFKTEAGYDALVVEYSLNGGNTWSRLDSNLGTGSNFNTVKSSAWYSNNSTNGPITYAKFSSATSYVGTDVLYSSQVNGWIQSVSPLTGLAGQSNVKIRFRFGADGGGNSDGWGIDDIEILAPASPFVTTTASSFVTHVGAIIGANITGNGGSVVTQSGILIGTGLNPTLGDPGVVDSANIPVITLGAFTKNLTGLTPSTTYHYRPYAINSIGTTYGPDGSFTTLAMAALPAVTKTAATNITTSTVTVGGNVGFNGGDAVAASGIVYSTNPNPVRNGLNTVDSTTIPLVTSGAFTIRPTGLQNGTKYYFRAYASNSSGDGYSIQDSFTTDPVVSVLPYMENFEAGARGWTSAALSGTNDWVLGTPAKTYLNGAHSGTKAWVTSIAGTYSNSSNSVVVSPVCDFTAVATDPILRFQHKFVTEGNYDALVVEISLNNGPWTRLDSNLGTGSNFNTANSYAWYNSASTNGNMTPRKFSSNVSDLGSDVIYSSQVNGWVQSFTPLTGAAGQSNVKVRFRFNSESSGVREGWAIDDIEIISPTAPTAVTSPVTNLTHIAATIGGNITNNGGSNITASGVVYSLNANPVLGDPGVIDSTTNPVIGSGAISKNLTGLTPSTIYHYRAYATNALGTSYGGDVMFTTFGAPVVPIVSTLSAINIGYDTATMVGNITSDGGDAVLASGVVYSTTPNPVIGGPGVVNVGSNPNVTSGTFSVKATGLNHTTKYYFKTYAINNIGVGYSNLDSFNTTFVISAVPYLQDFEGGSASWASVAIGGTNDWTFGTPAKTYLNGAHSGVNAWATKLTGPYSASSESALLSPRCDFSGLTTDPILRFSQKFITESYDAVVAEISINGGTWLRLDSNAGTGGNFNTSTSYSWYSNNTTDGPIDYAKFASRTNGTGEGSNVLYASQQNGWIQSATVLTGAAGQSNVRFRFRFASDFSNQYDGWAIDDIEIVASPTGPGSLASAVALPNITDTTTTLTWTNGNGNGRLVVARLTSTTSVAPSDFRLYDGSSIFATPVDSTGLGNYVVYNGTGTTVTVTKLTRNTNYTYDVYEYNGKYMHVAFGAKASNSGQTLPVKLISFVATAKENDVLLNWSTASETNNKGFEIERSTNGRTFEKVNFVKGAGNSSKVISYNFVDKNVWLLSVAEAFYRLKQVDLDGKYTYSNIVRVDKNTKEANALSAFPNPYSNDYSISFTAINEGNATVEMMDIQGKVVAVKNAAVVNGANTISMDEASTLKAGIYFVRINVNGEMQTLKLVKN
jgi:hypothetical protein